MSSVLSTATYDTKLTCSRSDHSWGCPPHLSFTGEKGCTPCSKEGNFVCGLDKYTKAKLKCTHLPTGLTWVPVKNPNACDANDHYNDHDKRARANCHRRDLPFT